MCSRMERLDDAECTRTISGPRLEEFVVDAAVHVLENLHITTATPTTAMSDTDRAAVQTTKTELAELKEMWTAQELSTREYRQMRTVLDERLSALQARTVIRPTASILKGITGPDARTAWQDLGDTGQGDRQNAILRFLFAAVITARTPPQAGSTTPASRSSPTPSEQQSGRFPHHQTPDHDP
jgi:site-specific DNA recombinase